MGSLRGLHITSTQVCMGSVWGLCGVCMTLAQGVYGNAVQAVRTQCEVLDVGKYSDPTFGPF